MIKLFEGDVVLYADVTGEVSEDEGGDGWVEIKFPNIQEFYLYAKDVKLVCRYDPTLVLGDEYFQ